MSTIQIRVDDQTKQAVDSLYASLGLDTSTAVRMFFSASLEADGLPFAVRHRRPNPETLAALKEAEDIIAGRVSAIRYDSVSAALDAALEEE